MDFLKFLTEWLLKRAMELVLGSLIIGFLLFLTGVTVRRSSVSPYSFHAYFEAVILAGALTMLFYVMCLFFISVAIHGVVTRNSTIRRQALTLAQLYTAHFIVLPIMAFKSVIFNEREIALMVACSFCGGLITLLIVNTSGTGLIRRMPIIGPFIARNPL